jgi:hypothetical protein
MSLITAISWHVVYPNMLHIDDNARAKQLREAHGAMWAPAGGFSVKPVRKAGAGRRKKTGQGELATSKSLDM